MGKTILNVLVAACFIAIIGCQTPPKPSGEETVDRHEESERNKRKHKEQGRPKAPVSPELAACRELAKSLNAPLMTAVRVATSKASGTPVEAMEVKEAGRRGYRVFVQGQSGKPKVIDVDQQMVDAEQIVEPSSLVECKSVHDIKEEKIVTAIRLAQERVPGRPIKAQFGKYEDRFLYTVTMEEPRGSSQLVRVDADARRIVKIDPE